MVSHQYAIFPLVMVTIIFPCNGGIIAHDWASGLGLEGIWTTDQTNNKSWSLNGSIAQSGDIDSSEKTTLMVNITLNKQRCLNFLWKVSSEANYDKLYFFVNNVEVSDISGDHSWTNVSKTLKPGLSALAWQFKKDGSVSRGGDTGWIKEITFIDGQCPQPPTSAPTPAPTISPEGYWFEKRNCHAGIIDTSFVGRSQLSLEEAKTKCSQSCENRDDCFYASLYLNETCYLHDMQCGDWSHGTYTSYRLWMRAGSFLYVDLGVGKCTVNGGLDPSGEYLHAREDCELGCTFDPSCTGYSLSFANNCLLWLEGEIDNTPGEYWGSAHCMKKKSTSLSTLAPTAAPNSCPYGFKMSYHSLSNEFDYLDSENPRVFNSSIQECADICIDYQERTGIHICTAFEYKNQERQCIIKVKDEYSIDGLQGPGMITCDKKGCDEMDGTYEDKVTLYYDGFSFTGHWIMDSRPDFFGNISSDCSGQMVFPDDKLYDFEYDNGTIYFGNTEWRKDIVLYTDLGEGKCTVNRSEPSFEYVHQAPTCQSICSSDKLCLGYSFSIHSNCILWKPLSGEINGIGGGWGQSHCMKKKEIIPRCQGYSTTADCCTPLLPCNEHEGLCRADNDCIDNLVCGKYNCLLGSKFNRCCAQPAWSAGLHISGGWSTRHPKWHLILGDGELHTIGQSARIPDSAKTTLTLNVTFSGTFLSCFQFWWKVSSEENKDFLEFWVDGERIRRISGEESWSLVKTSLMKGEHEISWTYRKDLSFKRGEDMGWISNMTHTIGSCPSCFEFGQGYSGSEYGNIHEEATSYADCQRKCQGNWQCNFFTFYETGGYCYLMSEIGTKSKHEKATSGRKYCADRQEAVTECPADVVQFSNNYGYQTCNFTGICSYEKQKCCGKIVASISCECTEGSIICTNEVCAEWDCKQNVKEYYRESNILWVALIIFIFVLTFYTILIYSLKRCSKKMTILPSEEDM